MWDVTMLGIHLAALMGTLTLFRDAPCWLQKMVMGFFIVVMLLTSVSFVLSIGGYEHARWPVFQFALVIEHVAVLLTVMRLVYRRYFQVEESKWTNSSAGSHSLYR